jgi:uncharacterized protein YbjT (DUF2867 family)
MKYVITGAAGHVSGPLTEKLLSQKHEVTLISRSAANIAALVSSGAKAAIGSVEDADFLTGVFAGADAVYTMVPPNMAVDNWKGFIAQIGMNYARAIKAGGVKFVVNLSSVGAELAENCGPINGLHAVEEALNSLEDVQVRHLRAGLFYENFLANIAMIKNLGIMGANFGGPSLKVALVSPLDIAKIAGQELSELSFRGHSVRYVTSDERTTNDIARVLGQAIGKPGLQWVVFSDADAKNGMIRAGLSVEIATNFAEMNQSLQSGKMGAEYWKNHPEVAGRTKLEDFANQFAAIYNAEEVFTGH